MERANIQKQNAVYRNGDLVGRDQLHAFHRHVIGTLNKNMHHILIAFSTVLFLCNQISFFRSIAPDWVVGYGDDAVFFPIVLSVTFFVHILLLKEEMKLTLARLTGTVIYVSLITEVLLPHLSSRYTADVFDVFAYSLGAIIFYWLIYPRLKGRVTA